MPREVPRARRVAEQVIARIQADGRVEYRTDPMWFTPYSRRDTVDWDGGEKRQAAE